MIMTISVTPFLWFNDNAEAAIARYVEVFPDTLIVEENRHPDGSLFVGTVELQGQRLTLMNGGPQFQLTEAFSLAVTVDGQDDVDRMSDALIEGGGEQSMCGWLRDAFGLSWQIVPKLFFTLMSDPDPAKSQRVQQAMLQMTRFDCAALQSAYDET